MLAALLLLIAGLIEARDLIKRAPKIGPYLLIASNWLLKYAILIGILSLILGAIQFGFSLVPRPRLF